MEADYPTDYHNLISLEFQLLVDLIKFPMPQTVLCYHQFEDTLFITQMEVNDTNMVIHDRAFKYLDLPSQITQYLTARLLPRTHAQVYSFPSDLLFLTSSFLNCFSSHCGSLHYFSIFRFYET